MDRQILHVDVNNAFLSWTAVEKLNNAETVDIRNIPALPSIISAITYSSNFIINFITNCIILYKF